MLEMRISTPPIWLRVLQFPLTRLVLLGGIVLLLMGMNNGFMTKFKGTPVLSIAITIAMAAVALAVYVGWRNCLRPPTM
jgi:hypothetical protein